ncbi:AAA family ATPase [Yersinia enterocolitica]|uniref:AAA family ATPase n=1 Tax=Yersinia enterocolitica TaxID=630 RepID=UPI000BF1BEBB|nr:ATP-binding protein [Yersinia enterocolitica]PNK73288.1 abortive phage infection protein [Yersinia enterocolitica]UYJ82513.1 AAA family ATPase [Yersinia enterocolitica]HDL8331143.1 AAA family ATPase [Yersinia enterocolitica]HDM8455465.1 AAA family ATPase [Yersinia enterocolitica]
MLVSLKIENFRSIRDQIEFTTIAAQGSNHLNDHLIKIKDENFTLVRSSGFYGPNASGKSNVLRTFAALSFLAANSGTFKENEEILCYEPYALSEKCKSMPTKFEIDFFVGELRYIYKIHYNRVEITFESLDCYFSKVSSNLFLRDNSGWENIKFGNQFKGGVKKIPFFKNNSYLSKIADTASSPEVVKAIRDFFVNSVIYIDMESKPNLSFLKNDKMKDVFTRTTGDFLSLVDTGITKITVEEKEVDIRLPDNLPEEIKKDILFRNGLNILFSHQNEDGGEVYLQLEDESDGTNRLFELAPAITSALTSRKILVIDEMEHSLHPHLASMVLRLFNDSELNKFNSQLIFSTHNMDLMKPEKMRRDQIWFSEKTKGSTNIFSLDDFEKDKVKASSPFNKWYDEGRFGGTPSVNYANLKKYFINIQSVMNGPNEKDNDDKKSVFGEIEDY